MYERIPVRYVWLKRIEEPGVTSIDDAFPTFAEANWVLSQWKDSAKKWGHKGRYLVDVFVEFLDGRIEAYREVVKEISTYDVGRQLLYKGVDPSVYDVYEMVKLKSICLNRAEGPIHQTRHPQDVASWKEASAVLSGWRHSSPEIGLGYHKVDVSVHWEDEQAFSLRVDLDQGSSCYMPSLVKRELKFYVGEHRPGWISQEWVEKTKRLLERYQLND